MFHVELRQFPHAARAFNLTREELDRRFVRPWVAGALIEHDDRRWSPEKARLTIYEAPELPTEEMGMGRGWGNVSKTGRDVTDRVLAEAQATAAPAVVASEAERFKLELVGRCSVEPQSLRSILLWAIERYPRRRISERLALAEQASWELLHEQRVEMIDATEPVPRDQWQERLLDWESWTGDEVVLARLSEPAVG